MKRILYTDASGLHIATPFIHAGDPAGFTEDQALARALAKVPADAVGVRVIFKSDIPGDRTFRDAWEDNGSSIQTNIVKARAVRQAQLNAMGTLTPAK